MTYVKEAKKMKDVEPNVTHDTVVKTTNKLRSAFRKKKLEKVIQAKLSETGEDEVSTLTRNVVVPDRHHKNPNQICTMRRKRIRYLYSNTAYMYNNYTSHRGTLKMFKESLF